MGIVGDPNSWQLWTIAGGALLLGGGCFWATRYCSNPSNLITISEDPPQVTNSEVSEPPTHVKNVTHQVADKVLEIKAPFLEKSRSKINPLFLQFLLVDFAGGKNLLEPHKMLANLDMMALSFKHYLGRFCARFPSYLKQAQRGLEAYISVYNEKLPLETIAQEILKQLEEKKYLTMSGGFCDGKGGGHALFYEWILEGKHVTLRITNSGSGLEYHPKDSADSFYRTLCLSGATIESLKKGLFLQLLISFMRMRPGIIFGIDMLDMYQRTTTVEDLYVVLHYEWPGAQQAVFANPGKAQRGPSCSLASLLKWFKWECDEGEHPWIILWIKFAAFSDYLENNKEHSSQLISDSLIKLAGHLDKMEQTKLMHLEIFKAWKELSQCAQEKKLAAIKREHLEREKRAFATRGKGLGLLLFEVVKLHVQNSHSTLHSPVDFYSYPHAFPGDPPPITELKKLRTLYFAPLTDEMSYRINFLHLLPDCTEWTNEMPLDEIGELLPLFFYNDSPQASLHLPDSFCVDLLNVWMGIYLLAKKEEVIPHAVLFEWIRGARLLVDFYTPEFSFEIPRSREKWKKLTELILQEEKQLKKILGSKYKPPENQWTVWDRDWSVTWMPFGVKFKKEYYSSSRRNDIHYAIHRNDIQYAISTYTSEAFPEMALFARQVMHKLAQEPLSRDDSKERTEQQQKVIKRAHDIEKFYDLGSYKNLMTIHKTIDAFACKIQAFIPHYDIIRLGLSSMFILFDKHLSRSSASNTSKNKKNTWFLPTGRERMHDRKKVYHPGIGGVADKTTRLRQKNSKPESVIVITARRYQFQTDLNERISHILDVQDREYPFMSLEEEKVFLTFVQKSDSTRFSELLAFFQERLYKLAIPEYQILFKHFLFGAEGVDLLQKMPSMRSLLFIFFENSYKILIEKEIYLQPAAAALFHLHLLLFAAYPKENSTLISSWKTLIQAGKKNPILGRALGKAIFAALPALEFVYKELEPELKKLLAISCLLECVPADYTKEPYSPLDLKYGWNSFKALMVGKEIWQEAAEEVFGHEEASQCIYDSKLATLKLKNLSIYLAAHTIEGGNEFFMQLIPEEYRDANFKALFGKENILAHRTFDKEGTVYYFTWKKQKYALKISTGNKIAIYKQIGSEWCRYRKFEQQEGIFYSSETHNFWVRGESSYFIEEKTSLKIIAEGEPKGIQRYGKDGKLQGNLLAKWSTKESFLYKVTHSLNCPFMLWANPKTSSVEQIEFPTLNLHFYVENRRVQSQEFPGFFISKNQFLPFLKNYRSALILENVLGYKKVIAPLNYLQQITYIPYEQESHRYGLPLTQNTAPPSQFLVFDLAPGAHYPIVTPSLRNQTKIMWLISLYLHSHEYHKALQLIEETYLTTQKPIHAPTKKLLKEVFGYSPEGLKYENSQDTHPYAVAVRLRLYLWSGITKDTEDDFDLYNNLKNSMGPFALKDNSLNLLSAFFNNQKVTRPLEKKKKKCGFTMHDDGRRKSIPSSVRKTMCSHQFSPPLSLTTPGEEFILNFLHYYELRIRGTPEEKREMRVLAYFAYQDRTEIIAKLGLILWHGKKIDLKALLKTESQEKFEKTWKEYLKGLERVEIEYPGKHIKIKSRTENLSPKISVSTTKLLREARYEPLPPMGLDIPYKEPVFATKKVGDPELYEWAEKQMNQCEDVPTHRQFARLMSGAEEKEEIAPTLQPSSFGASKEQLFEKEKAILAKANDIRDVRILHWDRGRGIREELDIETLMISLGRNDSSVIRFANPTLSDQEICELMQEVLEYSCLRMEGAVRAYNPAKRPKLVVFEALLGIVLRKEQIDALDALKPGTLLEARTGFGKSKCLVPLWLLLSAQESLVFFCAPALLFDEQERHLQEILKKAYRFFAVTLEFSRNSSATPNDLLVIEEKMRTAERLKRPVLMSDRTAHNLFVLKLKEFSLKNREAFNALIRIRTYVKDKKLYVDEPHKVLDDRQEFNYSIGGGRQIPSKRRAFAINLYKKLFKVIRVHKLEFWSEKRAGQEGMLTEESYREEILPLLAGEDNYLLGRMSQKEQRAFESTLTDETLRALHDQLHVYLPQTLMRNCGEHYTLDNKRVAIPLEGARNPRKNNEYVSIDQILNFTIQANLKIPFSLEEIEEYLQKLSRRAANEIADSGKSLAQTPAYKEFIRLIQGIKPVVSGLMNLQPEEISRIHAYINSSFDNKLFFIECVILPRVHHFEEKVSSSPHLLTHCFEPACGASGTLSMQHFPIECSVVADERAVVKTLSAMLKQGKEIVELEGECSLKEIRQQFPDISILIEVGADLRHYPSIDLIAQELLLLYPEFEGIATFDEEGQGVVMARNSNRWMPQESTEALKIFWFIGQKDTTGRDALFDPKAKAAVIINQHTTLTRLVQGVGRLRGILDQQTAKLVVDQQNGAFVRQEIGKKEGKLDLLDCINYCARKEGKENGQTNFSSLFRQLDDQIENALWDEVIAGTRPLEGLRKYIVQSTKDDILSRPSMALKPTPIQDAIEILIDNFNKKVKELKFDQKVMNAQAQTVIERMPYSKEVYLHYAEKTSVVETTTDQIIAEEVNADQESLAAKQTEAVNELFAWKNYGKTAMKHLPEIRPIPLDRVFSHENLKPYRSLFDNQLLLSHNALCTHSGDTPESSGFVNGYIKPLHYVALLSSGVYLLIDTQEAEEILQGKYPDQIHALYLTKQGPLIGEKPLPEQIERQAALFNGSLKEGLSPLEKKWIQSTAAYRAF